MTFSIVGRCASTGMFGVAITTSSISVGARCPFVRAGVGAVASQNVTDPSLGPQILDALALGMPADNALNNILEKQKNPEFRQLLIIDNNGHTACYTGEQILGRHAQSSGDSCYAAGNLLSTTDVPVAMTDAFSQHKNEHLAQRLLFSLQAGLDIGGEMGDVHSAALLVADKQPFPLVDLRVDWHDDDPLAALTQLWQAYQPQMQDYLTRAIDPRAAPSYGVPGDE